MTILFPVIGAPDTSAVTTADADGSTGGTPPPFSVHSLFVGSHGSYIFSVAGSTITAGQAVGINAAGSAVPLTKARADAGDTVGVANSAVATGQYFWAQTGGILSVNALTGVAGGAPVYTTATAGALSETSTSQTLLVGIRFTAANSSGGTLATAALAKNGIVQ